MAPKPSAEATPALHNKAATAAPCSLRLKYDFESTTAPAYPPGFDPRIRLPEELECAGRRACRLSAMSRRVCLDVFFYQLLGDLHTVECSALAYVIGHDPEI